MRRRNFLKGLACGSLAALCTPLAAIKALAVPSASEFQAYSGSLTIFNINTRETLAIDYLTDQDTFDQAALDKLNHLFRCKMTHQVAAIDPRLYLLLDAVQTRLGARGKTFTLISGYRSQEYNRLRASSNAKVSQSSYHTKGMAADVSLDGVSLASLRQAGIDLGIGGVGKYSDFIHLDVGPVRSW